MVTPAARREAAAHLSQHYEVSQRRACQVIDADRSTVRYRGRRPDDGLIRVRLRELAAIRRRFGYRRLQILLHREGTHMNHNHGQLKPEQAEIARLKREVTKLKAERDILKKAAAYFAKEST